MAPSQARARARRWFPVVALLLLLALAVAPSLYATARQASDPIRFAVEQVHARGAYSYDARIETTVTPAPRLANVGLSPRHQSFALRGQLDLRRQLLDLSILQGDGGYATGGALDIQIAEGVARTRVDGGAWQPAELPAGAFTPTSNFLGLLGAARDRSPAAPVRLGDRELTRYTFAIDGYAFAQQMRAELERSLRQQNRLVPGISVDNLAAYRDATGTGELLVDAAGLPVRQIVHLSIPDAQGQTVAGVITVDFAGFAPAPALGQPLAWAVAVAWDQLALSLGLLLAVAILLLGLVRARRTRPAHVALTGLVLVSLLTTPLLQAGRLTALAAERAAPAPAASQAQPAAVPAAVPAAEAARVEARASAFALAQGLAAGNDADMDGLTDAVEPTVGSDPARADSDNDGLSDGVEVLELGTRPTVFDTDGDGLGDGLEVAPMVGADGITRYLDPFQADTNRDGLNDFAECVADNYCPDTDGDGQPDPWDEDNDGDGVPDRLDSAPTSAVSGGPGPDGPLGVPDGAFELSVAGSQPGLPLLVDFTVRPTNPARLWYNGNVLDWPADDRAGQIKRVFENSFGSQGKLADGDMRLMPMLEISIPYAAGSFGGLPVKPSYSASDLPSLAGVDLNSSSATAAWFAQWLDQAQLDGYQASVRIGGVQNGRPTLVVYLPLDLLRDSQGGAPLAFTARMFYRPRVAIAAHSVRLAWSVQVLTDSCTTVPEANSSAGETFNKNRWDALPAEQKAGLKYKPWEKLSAAERSRLWCGDNANWRSNPAPTVAQTYYDDFYLSALDVSEERGINVAAVVEEPQGDTQPMLQHRLWSLARNLDRTFVAGRDCDSVSGGACQPNGVRDITVAEIQRRFDRLTNAGVSVQERWGIDRALRVNSFSFSDPGAMGRLFFGHTDAGTRKEPLLNTWLNTVYAPDRGPSAVLATPTVLVARERTYRTAGLSLATIETGRMSISLDDVLPLTQAGLSWQSFRYGGLGVWENVDVREYYQALDGVLSGTLAGAAGPTAATPEALAGSVRLLKGFYLSMVNGRTQPVAIDGRAIAPAAATQADAAIVAPAGARPTLAAFAESMAGLVMDNQAHRGLLAPADAGDLLDAIGRQSRYRDGGPALSLLQGLGHLRGSQSVGATLGTAVAAIAATIAQPDDEPDRITSEMKWASEVSMNVYDLVTGMLDVYQSVKAIGKMTQSIGALNQLKGVYEGIKTIYGAQQAVGATGKLLGTVKHALKEAGKFAVILTIVVELVAFVAKLVALIKAGEASFATVMELVIETIVNLAVGLIIMSVIAAIAPVGTLIAAIIALIDLVVKGICYLTGWDESENTAAKIFCEGIMGNITKLLMFVLYDKTPLVDMEEEGRLNPTNWQVRPVDPDTGALTGFVAGSNLALQSDVVTTLDVKNFAVLRSFGFYSASDLSKATFKYEFTTEEEEDDQRIHVRKAIATEQMTNQWRRVNVSGGFDRQVYTTTLTTSLTLDRAGLNWRSDGLYLAEGYATPALVCVAISFCLPRSESGSNYINLTDNFVFDVFPPTLDGFHSLTDDDGDGGFRLAWDERFPDLADADGDGLRSVTSAGKDPNDNSPDSDQDGLTDFYELKYAHLGLDPRRADTDADGLSDAAEIRLGLNPAVADADNDGLKDGEEIAGWEIVYAYTAQDEPLRFRTGSDPLDPDTDDDGILDKREQIYGFNPRVFNAADVLQIQSQLVEGDGRVDGIVGAGSSVGFTSVVTSTLRDRFALGLFESDLESTPLKPDLAPSAFRLFPQGQATLGGSIGVPAGASTQTVLLTRAGAIIADLQGISGGRTLWLPLDESAGPRFADASPFGHDAICAGTCVESDPAAYSGRALLLKPGRDPLRVASRPSLGAQRFTLTAWVNPSLQSQPNTYTAPGDIAPTTILARRDAAGTDYALDLSWRMTMPPIEPFFAAAFAVRPRLSLRDGTCSASVLLEGAQDLPQNTWSQLAAVYDGAQLRLYVNGVEVGSRAHTGGLCVRDVPIELGQSANVATHVMQEEQTRLDEVALYPYPMTLAQVQALFRDPVLRLGFNGTLADGSNLRQSTGWQGAGDLTIASSRNGDRVGVFDKKRWLQVGPSSSLDMRQGPGQFTLAAFVRPVPLGPDSGWQGVLGRENGLHTYPSLYVNSAGQLRAAFGTGSALCDSGATPALLGAGAWSHVAVSYTGTQFVFFVDGVERARQPSGCAAGSRPTGNQLYVGRTNADATLTLNSLVVTDAGDGAGNAEYFMHWGGTRIWTRNAIVNGTYSFDSHFEPGWSKQLAISGDGGQRLELFEDDDYYDDTQIDRQVRPFEVSAAGSWSYDDDGEGTLNWRLWNNWFNGDLDEVQVFRVALDGADARALYSRLNNQSYALHTRLEEPPTAALFRDGSGNLLTGLCSAPACPTTGLPGRDGQAARFGGDDAIVIADRPALDLESSFTVAAWVNLDDPGANQKIVGKFDTDKGGYLLGVENGQIYGELRDSRGNTRVVRGGSVPAGVWTHLAISASAGQQLIGYVNGVEVGRATLPQTTRADAAVAFPAAGSATLYVDPNYEDEIQTFSGDISSLDDHNDASSLRVSTLCVRLYDGTNHSDGSRPVCDDTPKLTGFEDVANSARVYTTPPSYDWSAQALRLNAGGLQHLRIEPATLGNLRFSTISVAAWVRPSNPRPPELTTIVSRGAAGGADGFRLRVDGSGRLNFQAGNGEWTSGTSLPNFIAWTHVAVTLDGQTVRFYINGAEAGSAPFAGNINDVGGPILIGRMPECGSGDSCNFFDGHMRDLAIFSRAIGADEVLGLRGSAEGNAAGNPEASGAAPNGRVVFLPFDGAGVGGGSRTFQGLVAEPIGLNDAPLTIGRAPWGNSFFARGLIDEVAVLEYAADQAGVAALMNAAPRLRLALDEPLGSTSFADTASTTAAACAGAACPQAGARGRIREALVFGADGVADQLSVPDSSRLDLARFSIELWVRPEAVRPGEQVILAKADGAGANSNYRLSLVPGTLRLRLGTAGGSVESARALNQGQWNHVVASYDGAQLRLFVNGTPEPAAAAAGPALNGFPLQIGSLGSFGVPFNGMLDELSLYGYALSAEEVAAHYLYQESWFDNVDRLNLTVDGDAPTAALSLADNTVIAAAPVLVSVAAADPTSDVAAVHYDDDGDALADDWKPAEPGADGSGWFFSFTPPVPGSYPLRARATDLFGRQSPVAVTTVRVDGAAPTVAVSGDLAGVTLRPTRGSGADGGVWLLPLSGVAGDALSAPVSVVASITGPEGLVGSDLLIDGVDGAWSGNYRFPFPPNGVYTLQLSAVDGVGNRTAAAPVALALDAHAPVADVTIGGSTIGNPPAGGASAGLMRPAFVGAAATTSALPPVLGGTVVDAPRPANALLLTHFEEQAGATAFLDSSFAQRRVACAAGSCPTAGATGQIGSALAFDGQNDTLHFDGLSSGDGDFAISLWLRPGGGATQVPLFATSAGVATVELRADGSRLGVYATTGGVLTKVGETDLAPDAWSHVALSFDGAELRAFSNGALVASLAAADLPAFDALWVGSRGGAGGFFQGRVDELAVYGAALSDEMARLLTAPVSSGVATLEASLTHLKDMDQPRAALRQAATLTPGAGGISAWSAPVPQGIEGPYLLDLASADRLGNRWSQPGVWSGEIDTRAPRVALFRRDLGDGTFLVSCVVEDYNLDAVGIICPVPQAQWRFESETAAWYQAIYGATPRQVRMRTPLVRMAAPADRIEACDSFGNCTSAASSTASPGVPGVSLIVAPGDGLLFTSHDPIAVRGYAYAEDGLQSLGVRAGATTFYDPAVSGAELLWESSFTPVADGVYALQATVTGAGGASFSDPDAPTITVDAMAPVVALTSLALADEATGTLALTGRVTETVGVTLLQARVDGGSWVDLPLPPAGEGVSVSGALGLAQAGPYDGVSVTVELRATDVASRTTTTSRSEVLDTVAPILAIDSLALADAQAGTLALTGRVTETVGLASLQARVDKGQWQELPLVAAGAGVDLSGTVALAQAGPYDGVNVRVELRATDRNGNTATTSRSVVLDSVAPILAIDSLALADAALGTLALTGRVTETVGLASLQARVDGGPWQALPLVAAGAAVDLRGTLALARPAPYDGVSVSVELRATDRDGNTATTSRSVVLDTVAPIVSIDSLALADAALGTLALTGHVTETLTLERVEVQIDGGTWIALPLPDLAPDGGVQATLTLGSPAPYDGLPVMVRLRATDKDGNVGLTSRSVVLDTVAPILAIDSLALADAQAGTLALTGRVTETVGLASLQARVDGGPWQELPLVAAGAGVDLSGTVALAQAGPYDGVSVRVELRATDRNGNTATTSRSVVLDNKGPELTAAVTGHAFGETVTVVGSVRDGVGVASVTVSVLWPSGRLTEHGAPLARPRVDGEQAWRYASAEPLDEAGAYRITVEALDTTGNRSQRVLTFTLEKPLQRLYFPMVRR